MRVKPFALGSVLALALAGFAIAQDTTAAPAQPQQSDQGVKSDVNEAAHATGRAAKKAAHKTKRAVKKGTHKAAQKTRQGAEKVEDKTAPNPPQN